MYIMDVRFSKNSLGKLFKMILEKTSTGGERLVYRRVGYINISTLFIVMDTWLRTRSVGQGR